MDVSRPPLESLLVMAKRHLSMSPLVLDSAVPTAYLEELKHHLLTHPHDTNFRVQLQPAAGLGYVTCLELSCGRARIDLVPCVKVSDGGRRAGCGSLSAYRRHIADHPLHRQARLARLKAGRSLVLTDTEPIINQSASSSSPTIVTTKRPSLLSKLDASFGSTSSSPAPIQSKMEPRSHYGLLVKPEPSEPVIPKKRPSDMGVRANAATGNSNLVKKEEYFSFDKPSPPKKMKTELPKTPLALINFNMAANPAQVQPGAVVPALALAEASAKYEEVSRRYTTLEAEARSSKTRRTKVAKRRFDFLMKEMDRLQAERQRYGALIQSLVPPKPALRSIPYLPARALPPLHQSSLALVDRKPTIQPVASGSNVRIPNVHTYKDVKMGIDTTDDEAMSSDYGTEMQFEDDGETGGAALGGYGEGGYGHNFDNDGNFHGRGRDTFAGPQAKADDIDKFLIAAGNAELFDGNASIEQALEKLGLENQYQLLPGMAVALMPHQIIGVAWMQEKEKGTHMLHGGILADEMGLGKTVQMIACMVINQGTDANVKTNLILAPTALLDQWKLEIEMKTNDRFTCHIYHGSSKAKKKQDLLKYDVVITTYATLAFEWPDLEAEEKAKKKGKTKKRKSGFITSDSEEDLKPKKKKKERGLLFQVKWHRIVLDEAQNIRNKKTRTSRCVTDLQATYRWCLTGTPITNSILDAYSLLRFLQIRPWYDWQYFNSHIAIYEKKNPGLATTKLQTIFATALLRRKKDSMLDGKRLIELPDKTVELHKLEFSEEERAIYQMIEARTQATFNRFLRAGTVLKNYHQVLVLLLRLRQVCSHPALIQEDGVALVGPEGSDESATADINGDLNRAETLVGMEFVKKMKHKLKELTLRRIEAEKASVDAEIEEEDCPVCMDVFTDATVTACSHIFCRECIVNVINGPAQLRDPQEIAYKPYERPCPSCRSPVSADRIFSRQTFEPTDADLNPTSLKLKSEDEDEDLPDSSDIFNEAIKKKSKGKYRAKPKRSRRIVDSEDDSEGEADSDLSDFILHSDEDEPEKDARRAEKKRLGKKKAVAKVESDWGMDSGDEDNDVIHGKSARRSLPVEEVKMLPRFLPSTKMKRMMELLTTWATEHPDEKTLIISQWTQCLRLVSDYLEENGFLHVKYQGDMTRPKRDAAVRVFMAKDKAQIMLMSLKCGGVGLNLTRANRVISLDLGWSEAVEAQAFDRVHRLGQLRNVFVERLVIADTVEDRVLALQERKKSIADGSLGEGTGKKIGRLSVRELANLFGLDHRGRRL